MKLKDILRLVLFVVICQSAGLLGAFFTFKAIPDWYATLEKPFFSPPNYLFGPVWTILYTLMGISSYLIFKKEFNKKATREALKIFFVQLLLNSAWSVIFFGFRNPGLAFIEILVLWCLILMTILKFRKISKAASYLLIPYFLWVTFASILNLAIFTLN
jgi:tryptophan-rich sensory protein